MPDRLLRPGIITSDRINRLSWPAEVFYRRLMSVADDYGRFDGRSAILRTALYPLKIDRVTEPDIGKWICECNEAGLVRVYSVDGKPYVEMLNFGQRVRSKSKWPDPPSRNDSNPPQSAADGRNMPPYSYADAGTYAGADSDSDSPPPPVLNGEIPTEQEAVDSVAQTGIPERFTRMVYADWMDRGGKDSKQRDIPAKDLPGHIRIRWRYEQGDWKSGKHRGLTAAAKQRTGPTLVEVQKYADEKGGEDAKVYAVSWHRYWSKHNWKRKDGSTIDWPIEFSRQWAGRRGDV